MSVGPGWEGILFGETEILKEAAIACLSNNCFFTYHWEFRKSKLVEKPEVPENECDTKQRRLG